MENSNSCYWDVANPMEFHSSAQLAIQPESPTPSLPDTEWMFPDHEHVRLPYALPASPRPSWPDTEWTFPANGDLASPPESLPDTDWSYRQFSIFNDQSNSMFTDIASFTVMICFSADGVRINMEMFYLTLARNLFFFDYISQALGCTPDYLASHFRVLVNGYFHMSPLDILGEDLHMGILILIH